MACPRIPSFEKVISQTIVFIVGPTAVGKSAVACRIARSLGGEIVSCDAMQVYQGISIASNKPTVKMLQAVPHHLIDFVTLGRQCDAAVFNRRAAAVIRRLLREGRVPVVTGGSGMYMQVLLDGIFESGGRDDIVRARLREVVSSKGLALLYKNLLSVDPESAKKIHPHDELRIIRALEVFESTGEPLSHKQRQRSGLWGQYDIHIFALDRERAELYDIINRRVDTMFAAGLVDEIRAARKKRLSATAARIIGLPEVGGYLDGEYSLEKARELMKLHTRRYAKRQLTWFRKDRRLQWIRVGPRDTVGGVAKKILNALPKSVKKRKTP